VIEHNVAKGGKRGEQASRVTVIKGKVEEISLGEGDDLQVDVIVSEWMGHALLYVKNNIPSFNIIHLNVSIPLSDLSIYLYLVCISLRNRC